ncbi:response regulator [Aquiflexum sp. TKW24L]|uniref:response regulator n=1 Tax=Aquiflexum sp. TKW24L TaxID=2942212 RepID=UPI0020BD55F3|nr:response regulator [Aquiflexum sp. TKW24L]MCL6260618.1 response regulator [Aquiflexum sp. TKW24L]
MKKIHVLLVEDNEGDILLTTEAFEESAIPTKLSIVKNGEEAIDFLFKRGRYKDVERPDLVLLDINLPIKNGHQVLMEVKSNDDTRNIPIIVLTTSDAQQDINKAYFNYANSYITKPLDIKEFVVAIQQIEGFWLELAKLSK